jgi:hypothetical protein
LMSTFLYVDVIGAEPLVAISALDHSILITVVMAVRCVALRHDERWGFTHATVSLLTLNPSSDWVANSMPKSASSSAGDTYRL